MSSTRSAGRDPARARRLLRRARLALYLALLAVVGYHFWRYDLLRLPPDGCSPLRAFDPGARLVVDRRPGTLATGDEVLYRSPLDGETLLLGRIDVPPPSAPAATWRACEDGALWIVGERADCPADDSRRHGPVAPEAVRGRVRGSLPW